jgi:hypothetical protein
MSDPLALAALLAIAITCAAIVAFTEPGQAPALAVRAAAWLGRRRRRFAAWLGRRHRANAYHRHGRPDAHRHAKPTLTRRAVMAVRRACSLRLRTPAEAPAPLSAMVTIPDGPFAARTF